MGNNTNQTLGTQQTKDLQAYLNKYGYTDDSGNALAVDGSLGPKTQQALQKFNVHQNHMNTPDSETRDMQVLLSESGYKNADGTPLKVDGVHGPNTDAGSMPLRMIFCLRLFQIIRPKRCRKRFSRKYPI